MLFNNIIFKFLILKKFLKYKKFTRSIPLLFKSLTAYFKNFILKFFIITYLVLKYILK